MDNSKDLIELPRDAVWPDYGDGGLFGLVRSFADFLDGQPWCPPGSPPNESATSDTLIFILVDGMGDNFLRRYGQSSCLLSNRQGRLTSVFPSTTASAVTTTMTGVAPAVHGLTGWFIRDHRFGGIVAPLPMRVRAGGAIKGIRVPQRLFPYATLFESRKRDSVVVSPLEIAWSGFSRRHCRGARIQGYGGGVEGMADAIVDAVSTLKASGGGYVHAYYPQFDSLSHDFGSESSEAVAEFTRIDRAIEQLLARLAGSGADVVVCADHGFTDSDDAHRIELGEVPGIEGMLDAPLFGERRAAFVAVRRGAERELESLAREVWRDRAVLVRSSELSASGLFGPGPENSRLSERTGTYTLLMEPGWTIVDRMPGESVHEMLGVHGGLTADEMWVPLIHAQC